MNLPPALAAWRAAAPALAPLFRLWLGWRVRRGKEDAARLGERFGVPGRARPDGRLIWLHGASVGESLVLLTLAEAIAVERPDLAILVTTGTRTSAELMQRRLPPGAIHQYAPADNPAWVRRFLDAWRPDAAVFAESELWPNLILETAARGVPMMLANARMNEASLRRWLGWRRSAQRLLGAFAWIGAADRRTAEGLTRILGREAPLIGNLKLEAAPDDAAGPDLDEARSVVGARPVWLAASTHDGEESVLLEAHRRLLERYSDALLILAPRHPERGQVVVAMIENSGLKAARRSAGAVPGRGDAVWLADTLGEMGIWFALAPAAFIAGSLVDGIGGHNPVEASRAGAAVITGPFTASFDDVYAAYARHGAALVAKDAPGIAGAVEAVWAGRAPPRSAVEAALAEAAGGALEATLAALRPLLPERAS